MQRRNLILFVLIFGVTTAICLWAFQTGAPIGYTGAPFPPDNSKNCTACHLGNLLNAPGGSVTILDVPASYNPGERYLLRVLVSRPGQQKWGFQITARFQSSGQTAGTLEVTDSASTQKQIADFPVPAEWITHTFAGTRPGTPNGTEWQFAWVAPASGGTVQFFAAGNAANNNQSTSGDFIYITDATSQLAPPPMPQISDIGPTFGPTTGGTQVTINGQNFRSNSTVRFGSVSAQSVTFVSSTQLRAVTPAVGNAGKVNIEVTNPGAPPATLSNSFTYFDPNLKVGYSRVTPGSGSQSPQGTAIFNLTSGGVLLTSTGVASVNGTNKALLIVENRTTSLGQFSTGVAIANPSPAPITLNLTPFNPNGTAAKFADSTFVTKSLTIPANNQIARFVNESDLFGSAFNSFTGTVLIESQNSNQQFFPITIRVTTNSRGEPLLTTFPVADASVAPGTNPVVLPHLVDGGGIQTQLLLVNATSQTISGTIRFFTPSGAPLSLSFEDVSGSEIPYTLAPNGSRFLNSTRLTGSFNVGYAVVTPNVGQAAPAGTIVFNLTTGPIMVTTAGVPVSRGINRALLYVDRRTINGVARNTGIAIANAGTSSMTVTAQLRNVNGSAAQRPNGNPIQEALVLGPGEQRALFMDQIFPNDNTTDFVGTLVLTASSGNFNAVTLLLFTNQRGESLLTTLPVADLDAAPSAVPLIFPHIVAGGGFDTQIILLDTLTMDISGTIAFFLANSSPMILPLNNSADSLFNWLARPQGAQIFQ